jgi:hypothetical protein
MKIEKPARGDILVVEQRGVILVEHRGELIASISHEHIKQAGELSRLVIS